MGDNRPGIKKMVVIYAVYLVEATSMKEVFSSRDKTLCKQFKRNNRAMGKLAIGIKETVPE